MPIKETKVTQDCVHEFAIGNVTKASNNCARIAKVQKDHGWPKFVKVAEYAVEIQASTLWKLAKKRKRS